MKNTIFVQIASYRDPELVPTLDSLFQNAKHPNNLKICIAWQHDETESLGKYKKDKRIKVLDIPYQDAKGVCWARNLIQKEYNGEKYTLQLDSHHRFNRDWDITLIEMVENLQRKGYSKPLITSYLPHFDPLSEEKSDKPWVLVFDRFFPEGPAFPVPEFLHEFEKIEEPLPARFYSAHFAFTLGQFSKEVPHDPELYFHGEEPSIGIRAFTHGYDLFHPHRTVAWHEYTRKGKTKHWDDDRTWGERNTKSYLRYRKLFSMDGEKYDPSEFGEYGLGNVRSLRQYIEYSGIDVTNRRIQEYTKSKKYPPNPVFHTEEDYNRSFIKSHKHIIKLHESEIDINEEYDFWVVAFKDQNKKEIFRSDADSNEVKHLLRTKDSNGWISITRTWESLENPVYFAVWPHHKEKEWLTLIERKL